MYSRNDYRYYLEHRLNESNDFLAHYGIKGMKWHKHKVGLRELNTVINRDQEAFYARNSQDADRALRQKREAQKKYDKTLLGKADKKTNGLATAPYRLVQNKARAKAEEKIRAKKAKTAAIQSKLNKTIEQDQARGRKRTAQEHVKKDQERGKKRTAQMQKALKVSSEYHIERSSNSKKNTQRGRKKNNMNRITVTGKRKVQIER